MRHYFSLLIMLYRSYIYSKIYLSFRLVPFRAFSQDILTYWLTRQN